MSARLVLVGYEPSRTGVCVVKIAIEGNGVLITLRENADIERISIDRKRVTADVNAAVQAVHEFLVSFIMASRPD